MKFLVSLFCAFVLVFASPSEAQQKQFTLKEMEALLIIISSNTKKLGASYQKTYGLKKSRATAMAQNYKAVIGDPKTRTAVAKIVLKSVKGISRRSPEQSEALVNQRVSLAMQKMSEDGLKRMSKRSQLGFFQAVYPIFAKSSVKDCAVMFRDSGALNADVAAEINSYNKITTKELNRYFLFLRKSIEFSANNRGRAVKISRKDKAKAEAIFANAFVRVFLKHKNRDGILRAIEESPSATDRDYCDMGRAIMKYVISAPEEEGGVLARYILSEV